MQKEIQTARLNEERKGGPFKEGPQWYLHPKDFILCVISNLEIVDHYHQRNHAFNSNLYISHMYISRLHTSHLQYWSFMFRVVCIRSFGPQSVSPIIINTYVPDNCA